MISSIIFKGVKPILSTDTLGNRRTAFCFHTWKEMQNELHKGRILKGVFGFPAWSLLFPPLLAHPQCFYSEKDSVNK